MATPLINRTPPSDPASYDPLLKNCYIERAGEKSYVIKRPGFSTVYTYGSGTMNGQGVVYYNGYFFAISNNSLYRTTGAGSNAYSVGNAWTNPGNATWKGRSNFASVVFQNQIFVIGGNTGGTTYHNDVWSSIDGTTWTQLVAGSPWGQRAFQKATVFNNKIWLMGGSAPGGTFYNDVWSSPDGVNWTQETSAAQWGARTAFALFSFNNGMYVCGGSEAAATQDDVWYSSDGVTWSEVTNAASFGQRSSMGFSTFANKMWIVGGYNAGGAALATVYYSSDGATWTAATSIPAARALLRCVDYAGKLWAIGGYNAAAQNTVYSTSDGVTWTTNTAGTWSARFSHECVVFKAPTSASATNAPVIWLMGGDDGGASLLNSLYYTNADGTMASSWAMSTTGAQTEQWQTVTVNNNSYLCLKNTYDMYLLYAGQVSRVTDPNYPPRTVPGVVNLDSTVYVMDAAGVIYGCDLSNPTVWGSLNFVTAEYEADTAVCLAKVQNYVVALKDWTTQFFYDTGAGQGSPLAPVRNANARIGCASAGSVVQMDNTLVYMAKTFQAGRSIVMLNGFQPVKISNAFVDKILNGDSLSGVNAFSIKTGGHDFYILSLSNTGYCLVYDMVEKEWYNWSWNQTSSTGIINYATDGSLSISQKLTSGSLVSFSPSTYQDDGNAIAVSCRTDLIDFNSNQKKFMSSLIVVGDKYTSTNNVTVFKYDDNYNTVNFLGIVDMSSLRPIINRCGSFRRRALTVTHSDSMPLRLEAFEIQLMPGDL